MRRVRDHVMVKWQDKWRVSTKGRTTSTWFTEVRLADEDWLDYPRDVTSFLTGHGPFNRLEAVTDSASCGCGDVETWDHVLKDCPIYDDVRSILLLGVGTVLLFP